MCIILNSTSITDNIVRSINKNVLWQLNTKCYSVLKEVFLFALLNKIHFETA